MEQSCPFLLQNLFPHTQTVREHVFRLGETERDRKEQREMYTLELALERGGVYGHSKKNINSSRWPWTTSKETFEKEEFNCEFSQ